MHVDSRTEISCKLSTRKSKSEMKNIRKLHCGYWRAFSGSCPVADFGINVVEHSSSAIADYLVRRCIL
jgi:hypothetical protein